MEGPPPAKDYPADSSFIRWLRQPETLIGLSAVVLSVCGLGIALYEASLIRAAQRANVWPHVEVAASVNSDRVMIWVQNTGVGPARIVSARLTADDQKLSSWRDLMKHVSPVATDSTEYYISLINGRVLPASSERESAFELSSHSTRSEQIADAIGEAVFRGNVDVEVCYCSVFDDCWISRLQDLVSRLRPDAEARGAEPVASCASIDPSGI